jgi:hypothetical protein
MYKTCKATVLTALVLAVSPSMAQACITADEVDALAMVSAPAVINTAVKQCSVALGKNAYLLQNQDSIIAKFADKRDVAMPAAFRAVQKVMKGSTTNGKFDQAIAGVSSDAILKIFENGMISEVKLDAKSCLVANEVIATLAPLPPENLTRLFTIILQLPTDTSKKSSFTVCPLNSIVPVVR